MGDGLCGDQGGKFTEEDIGLGNRLGHETFGKMGERAEKRAVKSKGTVSVRETETHDLNLGIDEGTVLETVESTEVIPVFPDPLAGMVLVVLALEIFGFLFILGDYFCLKRKIILEKFLIFHYAIDVESTGLVLYFLWVWERPRCGTLVFSFFIVTQGL